MLNLSTAGYTTFLEKKRLSYIFHVFPERKRKEGGRRADVLDQTSYPVIKERRAVRRSFPSNQREEGGVGPLGEGA